MNAKMISKVAPVIALGLACAAACGGTPVSDSASRSSLPPLPHASEVAPSISVQLDPSAFQRARESATPIYLNSLIGKTVDEAMRSVSFDANVPVSSEPRVFPIPADQPNPELVRKTSRSSLIVTAVTGRNSTGTLYFGVVPKATLEGMPELRNDIDTQGIGKYVRNARLFALANIPEGDQVVALYPPKSNR